MLRSEILLPIKTETARETRDRERAELVASSIARWKAAEGSLSEDQTPLGNLRRALFDQIGRDGSVQTAFNNYGYFPGSMELLILNKINEGLDNWVKSLAPEQREALSLQTPDSIKK